MSDVPLPQMPYFMSPDIRADIQAKMHTYAAAVSAADNADIQKLYLDAVEQAAKNADEVLALRADNTDLQNKVVIPLREQLTLAETVRASQVAGLTEGSQALRERVAGLEQDAARWRHVRDKCAWTATSANGMTRIAIRLPVDMPIEADDELDAAVDAARAALKGEA